MRRLALAAAFTFLWGGGAYAEERTTMHEPFDPSLLRAPHVDEDGRYFNPWKPFDKSFIDVMKFFLGSGDYDDAPAPVVPVVQNDGTRYAAPKHSASVTWVGHSTVLIHEGSSILLTDPHFSKRAFFPKRFQPPGVPVNAIPADAVVLISHNHYDHLDEETVEMLPADVTYIVPLGLKKWFIKRGRENVIEMDWWQQAAAGSWRITAVPVQHWSRRFGMGRNETLWAGYVIESPEYRHFFAGDTGYFPGFAEYGRIFDGFDTALLPIGAYEPRWFMKTNHMNPTEALRAMSDLDARFMVPIHWGTFKLTYEPIDQPVRDLAEAIKADDGDFSRIKLLAVGEEWDVPSR